MSPVDWPVYRIAALARLETGHTPDRKMPEYWNGDIPWVSLQDIEQLKSDTICRTKESVSQLGIDNSSARILPKDTVVFSRTASVGLCSRLSIPMATSQDFVNFICGPDLMPEYLVQVMRGMKREWHRLQAGSTHKTIYYPEFEKIRIPVPPKNEQRRIVEILRTWDEAVEKTERQITLKERTSYSLSECLMRETRRSGGNRSNWTEVRLREVTCELSKRNSGRYGREKVMGVNKTRGMIAMKDHVIASSLDRYKIVPPNAFAYNPMRLNIGSIARNEFAEEVLVSPDYVVFEAIPQKLEPRFLDHLRRSAVWTSFVGFAGTGSVRVRIYYDDLAALKFRLPPLGQQKRIADFLDVAAQEIEILSNEAVALAAQKRGLMQKLLTSERRLPIREDEIGRTDREASNA